ncbi:SMP-30/gluconolactonase/LRE family protein [Roseomonas sp. M0104]|uniref:SMP-30/gluconolactonase/LRE family protein n=1 Tax=Teichococcus coralli TaxID=2545983 RepID=A0A845B987_9PROT|nr:SMP-30/gluconolactonase/LRE family protein [Pseudoroseomonas coralli]MXP62664.1 SMP-30/gluconolactonase/LRE family protein [Pseudoroseomonas coralli]
MAEENNPPLRVLAEGLRFPEGPVWMPDGSVLLVEIAAGVVSRIGPDGRRSVAARTGGGPNGLAMGPGGKLYVCNNGGFDWTEAEGLLRPHSQAKSYAGGSIQRVDLATGAVETLYTECDGVKLRGPNDIVFDNEGGFWFSDLGKVRPRDRDHGAVFWAAADGSRIVEAALPVPGGANGIGLSPDGKVLYAAETETGRLWAWEIEGPGRLRKQPWPSPHGGRLICQFPGFRRLDSLAVTAAGNICVATLVSGEITTVAPSGEILRVVKMPELMPTNICFGGPELRTAYVTLSTTGKLVELPWDEPGLRLAHD